MEAWEHGGCSLQRSAAKRCCGVSSRLLSDCDGKRLLHHLLTIAGEGFPICFGVFQNHYSALLESAGNTNIALIGTVAQGLYYLGAPFSAALTKRYPKYQRQQIWDGWLLCHLGLVAGSFKASLGGLIANQGVKYGVGFLVLTYPIISMVDEWWVARKGMAFGLISAASGVAGAILPFIIEAMLNRYGYQTTLRASAVAMAILTGPLMPALKGRLPPAERSTTAKTNWSFLKKPWFLIYCFSTLVQGFGFFILRCTFPPMLLQLVSNLCQVPCLWQSCLSRRSWAQFVFGYMSDKQVSVSALATACSIMATVAVFALWGTAKSLGLLLVFSVVYGFFGYSFGTMRVAMGRAVSDDPSAAVAPSSILLFLQGIWNISVGPISTALMSQRIKLDDYGVLRYKDLVIFTGVCMFLSALIIALWRVLRLCWKLV